MGWWPFSSGEISSNTAGPTEHAPAPKKRDFSLTDEQHQRIFGRPRQDHGSAANARDEQADSELSAFLKEIGATPEPSSTTAATSVAADDNAQPVAAPLPS